MKRSRPVPVGIGNHHDFKSRANSSPPGDYKVQVTATPDSGSPATLELTVKVIAK